MNSDTNPSSPKKVSGKAQSAQIGWRQQKRSKLQWICENALTDWYGHRESAILELEAQEKSPKSLKKLMGEVIGKLDSDQRVLLREIIDQWDSLVGPEICFQARPQRIYKEILFIEVNNPTWKYSLEINFKDEIQQLVRQASKNRIKAIKFISGGKTKWQRQK